MSYIQSLFKGATLTKGTQPNGASMVQQSVARTVVREMNGQIAPYKDDKVTYIEKGYNLNDIFYMCVKLIVDKATLAPWAMYEVVDEAEYKRAKAYRKQLGKPGMLLKYNKAITKALKPYTGDAALNKLLKRPNEENSLSKHHALLWTYKLVTGEYYERWGTAGGGLNGGLPNELEVLPSQFMNIQTNRAIPLRVTGYVLLAGTQYEYSKEEVIHEAYPNLDWTVDGNHFYGMAPIKAALRRNQRNNESQACGAAAVKNGGVKGIAYLKLPPGVQDIDIKGDFTNDQVAEMKLKYEEMLRGGSGTAGTTVFSGYEVGFTEIGLSPADLDQMNIEKWDSRMMAANLGVPSQLINDPDNKTFANQAEGEKALTLRCAVPLLDDREDSLNKQIQSYPQYAHGRYVASYDLSVYSELEENKKEQTEYLAQAWWIKPNRKQEIQGETVDTDPMLDKYYVPAGLVALDDLNVPPADSIDDDVNALEEEGIDPI